MSSTVQSPQASAAHEAPEPAATGPLLTAQGLTKSYRMGAEDLRVLSDCSLSISQGEFVAIMGKSGSGKSTLLHILGALDVPQQGQVLFRGRSVFAPQNRRSQKISMFDVLSPAERMRIRLRRRHFGFVFQFYHLLPELNVLENVLITRMVGVNTWRWPGAQAAARADTLAILERVGLAQRLRHRPSQLSGGERQRVAIARALVHRPDVLLADEPTGNLDAENGAALMTLLKGLHRDGQTIVMVTHDSGIAQYADRTLVLERGRLRT